MKKIILTVFAALMALAVFTGCEYKVTLPEPTLKVSPESVQDGNKFTFTFLHKSNSYVVKKGDILTFVIYGTPNKDVSGLTASVVDNTKAAKWWKELSNYEWRDIKLEKNKKGEIKFDIEITSDSTGFAPEACKLALSFDPVQEPVQEEDFTFTVSSFYMEVKK